MTALTIALHSFMHHSHIFDFPILISKLDSLIDRHNFVLTLQDIEDAKTLKTIEN
jgi:hypothetical protein